MCRECNATRQQSGWIHSGKHVERNAAEELKSNKDCISLWIYGNGITLEGATEIAKGLKENTTLEVLDLHDNSIGNEGAKVLAQALKQNRTLKVLNICSNGVGPKLPQVPPAPRTPLPPARARASHWL